MTSEELGSGIWHAPLTAVGEYTTAACVIPRELCMQSKMQDKINDLTLIVYCYSDLIEV